MLCKKQNNSFPFFPPFLFAFCFTPFLRFILFYFAAVKWGHFYAAAAFRRRLQSDDALFRRLLINLEGPIGSE